MPILLAHEPALNNSVQAAVDWLYAHAAAACTAFDAAADTFLCLAAAEDAAAGARRSYSHDARSDDNDIIVTQDNNDGIMRGLTYARRVRDSLSGQPGDLSPGAIAANIRALGPPPAPMAPAVVAAAAAGGGAAAVCAARIYLDTQRRMVTGFYEWRCVILYPLFS